MRLAKENTSEAIVKASVNSANLKSYALDPKPGELAMSRVKFVERQMEARTLLPCNTLG
jgi:hypothetical protein